ncbi:IgGFc-binding protein-like [Psammomys obesus]|uniref:IgGFc-binding protein-like n=1 Tax=Psammomys obesus TaxID=48139 RepID=UPI0024529347|nr:IgGFc-binding protein-like [Psammomys obesus]
MGSLWSWWALWAGAALLWARLAPAQASCHGIQCTPGQRCQMVSGKARCVAESTAVCRAHGDPHYTTFDGRRYDMMGTCSYTMAELCGQDETLPAFSVEAKNEHRGSRQVSYVGLVIVYAYSHSVSLVRGETGFVQIDYQHSSLPASLSEGRLRVFQSGIQGVIELDFGLVVTYDWDRQLTLSLPKRFQDQVCGLCGNYNGDPADDFLMPDGKQAADVLNFTKSWKVANGDVLCDDGCSGNCPSCTKSQAQLFQNDVFCGLLILPTGPFADCHEFLDPKPFLEECVFDMCVTGGERLTLCHGLSAYARACVDLGISVREWRSRTKCPLSCPANSHYQLCSPACPASCNSEAAPSNCSGRPCVEGCVCLPGFLASRGLCVPVSSCGCTFEGRLLAPDQEVFADDSCRRRCTCDGATQKVSCRDTSGCLPGERCGPKDGFLGCFPQYYGECRASGDPHYMSLDSRVFNFMGTCSYLFTASCGQHPSLPGFRVIIENERRGSQTVSFARSVLLEVYDMKFEILRDYPGKVLMNGIQQYLPFQVAGGKIVAYRRGLYAFVRTDFGLLVSYNWDTHVTTKVPSNYAKAVCGLCGNFNGNAQDDLGQQNHSLALDPQDFGRKWLVATRPGCRTDEQRVCPNMNRDIVKLNNEQCRVLSNRKGHFKHCWKEPTFNSALIECIYDNCRMPGQTKPICDSLATYTAICQDHSIVVYPWRTKELCPMNCPPHSHYEICFRGCPLTCGDMPVPGGCGTKCYESCVCDDGYVLSGDACVPLASCGCVHQGIYHPAGDDFYPGPECNSLCHCHKGGLVTCQPSHCSPHEVCKVSDGILRCVAVGEATCQVSGTSHYTTFDGLRFNFTGTCVYVLAQTCWSRPGLQPFTILQENVVWGNKQGSVTKMITIQVANYTLQLEQSQWRVKVRAEMGQISCPDNSHYELCSPPCPAICPPPARHTTPAICNGPCVEGCQCDQGFVLSAGRCVPLDGGCGCWVNGTYHEAGTEFWTDATCSERCHCGPGGNSLVCKPASCGLGEECALLPSGQLGCQPTSTAQCQAWGDPHYITLDGHKFDFQGTCEYLLSAPCRAPPEGTEFFKVTVANEHRGGQAVSYTQSVTLQIYGLNLTVSAHWPGRIQVNGEFVSLPFRMDQRLSIYLSGADVVMNTASGISLAFDGHSFVRLRVPAAYAGALCGLCGNYNKNPSDDLAAVDGKPEGWKVGGTPGCDQCQPGPCPPPCTPEQQEPFRGPDACGIISAPEGPLAPCHHLVPPTQYLEACLLDACQVQGHPGGLCPAVATYVAACQAAGAQLGEWRKPDFCPLQCPANSHYQLCGDSCPVSCPSLSAPEGCETTCREGCVCDSGFVLSGDACVPVGQCGCLYSGRYYQLGATFYPGPECERRCECASDGQVSCKIDTCGIYEECRMEDGVRGCYPQSSEFMLVLDGTHYATLDGRVYDLHGSCSYVLARVCYPKPGVQEFSIVLEKNLAGDLQRMVVTVEGQVVVLAQGPHVTVDSEAVMLPVVVGSIYITIESRNMFLQTKTGLKVLFDGDGHILMSIPSPFRGRICGLCGNFNGNWSDDFVLPSGAVAPSVEAFGTAWRAPGSSLGCGEGCGPQGCPVCLAENREAYEKNESCGKIRDPQGPFAACHQVLSPSEYFHQCVYDLCAHKGKKSYLCRSLAAYTAACQAAGAPVKPWRTDSFCPLPCPAHSHYSVCTRSCQGSCAALSGLTGCTTRCFEGCECDDHFLLSQGVCIPARDCGCTHNGQYMPVNSSLMSSDCSERCYCSPSTGLTCYAAGCTSGRVCEIQAGVRDCWPAKGLCSLSVGANLTTFDGAHNAISSPGVYELSSRCPGLHMDVPWYRVVANVKPCHGNDKVVGEVHIFFQDGMITVTSSNSVWVNGLRVDLPAKVLTSVSVRRLPDGSMLVRQDAGVQVWLGKDGHLDVMVSENHAAKLCGACGNFDGEQINDVRDSQGQKIAVEKWTAQDFSSCSS